MKKGLIFATTLAMALGVGVAVGAHQNKAVEVKAEDKVIYCKVDKSWWTTGSAAVGAYYWGGTGGPSWPGVRMTSVTTDPTVWKITIPSGHSNVIFTRVNPTGNISDWGAKTDDLTIPTDSKNLYVITQETAAWDGAKSAGAWQDETYVEPTAAAVYKYSLNGGAAVELTKATGTEYASAELDFAKGDVLSFTKDSSAYAVTPKDSGQQTKVYAVEGGLKFAEAYHGKLYLETATAELWAGQFTPGYYLAGVKGEWEPKLAIPAVLEEGENPAYAIEDVALNAGDGIKVINFPTEGNAITWYNVSYENEQPKVATSTEVAFTVDDDLNLVVTNAGTYNVYYNVTSGWYSIEDVNYTPDIPAEEGYYICGEFSSVPSWKYDGATKMTATSQDGNVAYHMNFSLAAGDQLRVRSYFDAQDPKDRWATVGNEIDTTDPDRLFDKEGDNLKARVAGYYDVYAKYEQKAGDESEQFYFYVSPHVNTYEIEMTAVKFIGAAKEGTAAQESQVAYAGQVFNPVQPAMAGYALRGYYTDEACTTAYVAHEFEAAGHLYAKYTKAGFYVTYGTSEYSIDGATPMTTAGIAETNKAEAALTVTAKNSTYSFVYYGEDGVMSGHSGLGDTYAYAENEESHIKFTELGTYAVYWSEGDNKIYLNDGSTAYATTFLTNTGAVCQGDHKAEGYISSLKAVWAQEKLAFENLSDGAKAEIRAVGFNGGDEKGSAVEQLVARYHHIVWKYGSEEFEDFIFNSEQPIPPHHDAFIGGFDAFNSSDNTTMIIVISIAAVSALAFTTLLVFKKRKQK